ncbi:MAG: hypothetical protein JWQ98_2797 [Chlorobi bacterium]|nr:hypothetical protein [Chlorobiota bacterium]
MDKQTRPTGGRSTASSSAARPTRRATGTRRRVAVKDKSPVTFDFMLGREATMWVGAGVAVILIGYLLMATAISGNPAENNGIWNRPLAVTLAPILLAIGYCVIVPLGLLRRNKTEDVDADSNDSVAGS